MSLLNLWVSPERALVSVDTACADFNGTPGHISKLLPLVHAKAVLAGRGNMGFLFGVFLAAQHVHGDFDAIADALPSLLGPTYEGWAAQARQQLGATEEQLRTGQNIALVGWSETRQRVCGSVHTQLPGAVEFTSQPLREPIGALMTPAEGLFPSTWPALDTHEDLLRLAREQTRIGSSMPGVVIGGRLVIAEITRGGMSIVQADALL